MLRHDWIVEDRFPADPAHFQEGLSRNLRRRCDPYETCIGRRGRVVDLPTRKDSYDDPAGCRYANSSWPTTGRPPGAAQSQTGASGPGQVRTTIPANSSLRASIEASSQASLVHSSWFTSS